jgi:hypothetical protein
MQRVATLFYPHLGASQVATLQRWVRRKDATSHSNATLCLSMDIIYNNATFMERDIMTFVLKLHMNVT